MRGQAPPFRVSRRLPISEAASTLRRLRSRAASIVVATLPIVGALAITSSATPVHASAATITAPTYVRTIGSNGQSTMYPSGVAVDATGNVYVSDTGNYQVEKYQAGTTNLLWSVGERGAPIGGGTDSFIAPRDIATDGTHVFVADTDNADVQELNASDGSFMKEVKTFGSGGSQTFLDPIGISVGHNASSTEEILVSDGVTGNVYVFDTSFNLLFTVGPPNPTEGTRDAATDSAGNIYTADYRGNAVDKYSPTGTFITSWGAASGCTDVTKPYGVDIDTADTPNRVYVASSTLEQIKVFDTSGNCLNVGATGSNSIGTKVTTNSPTGLFQLRRVAVGSGSNPLIYAADLWGLKILTYKSSDGTIASSQQPVLGSGTYPVAGGLNEDHGIAIDPSTSQMFVANTVNQRIERFNLPNGDSPFDWGTKGVVESSASFNWAQGVGYDPQDGNVWVANTRNNRIDEFSTDGTPIASCPNTSRLTSSFNWPMAVAFDPSGTMYVADTFNNRIEAISVSQCSNNTTVVPIWSVGVRGSGSGQFIKPWDIAYDPTQNRLLVTDTDNSRIVSLNPSNGAVESLFPTITKGSAPGQVQQPEGIAVDSSGNIWVADTGNNRVEEFTGAGTFANQMVGTYGCCFNAPNTALNAPQGLAFDSNGLLYVADANNNRIQVFQPSGGSSFGSPGPYTGVPPFRICDTRPIVPGVTANQCNSGSGSHGPLGPLATRAITVGITGSGVPATGVSAVVVNLTAIAPSQTTYLTLYPSNGSKPLTSNITPSAGQVVANLVEVAVSSTGQFNIFNAAGTINVAIDIEGWVSTTSSTTTGLYNPTTPTRICDTRSGLGISVNQCDLTGPRPVLAGHPLTFDIHGSGSPIPSTGVSAVVFNLTAILPTAGTVLTAYPSNVSTPKASNINLPAGAVVPNRVIVPVPAHCAAPNCTVTIANGVGSVNVAVDIDGWYTDNTGTLGAQFSGVEPSRLCDTRIGNSNDPGCAKAAVGAGGVLNIQVAGRAGIPPMSSSSPPVAVVINVTAVQATAGTYVNAYSSDVSGPPRVSDLNVLVGQADTNLVVVQVGSDGTINFYNAVGSVELIVDVFGYYSSSSGPITPTFQGDIFNAGGVAPMYPAGGQTDPSGNMYLADSGGSRVDKITPAGALSYIVPLSGTPLSNPRNLSLDVSDPTDMWVTDTGNNGLVEMSTTGTVLQNFNASSTTPLLVKSPFGNDNDATGVYVADTYDGRIIKVDKTSGALIWSQTTCVTAMSRPRDVAVGSDGNIYAVDTDSNRVVELDPTTGACITAWNGGSQVLHQPRALTSDGSGGLWIAEDGQNPAITHYTDAGVFIGETLNTGTGGSGFIEPEGVLVDGSSVVAADPFANQVITFAVTSGVPAAAGTATNKGGPALGGFNNPFGVAYAPNGDCFVTDMFNQRIEKFTGCTGTPIATGNFGGGPGNMQNPRGISVSPDGSTVILTNSEDERIDLFSASTLAFESSINAVISTCGSKDLFFPHQVAFDATNNSYWVADTNNNRIVDLSATTGDCLANWTGTGATVNAPRGIVWDGTSVWVANAQTGQILQCTIAGACTAVAARTGTPTIVNSPWNLTLANGHLYIADEGAGKVVVMNMTAPFGTVYTFGSPGSNPSLGQLSSPRSVSVSPLNGDVAVADFSNNDISIWK